MSAAKRARQGRANSACRAQNRRAERAKSARQGRAHQAPRARSGRAERAHPDHTRRVRRAGTARPAKRRTARGGVFCPVLLVSLRSPRLRSVIIPRAPRGYVRGGYIGTGAGGLIPPLFGLTRRHFCRHLSAKRGVYHPPMHPLHTPNIPPESALQALPVVRATPPHAPSVVRMGSLCSP